MPILKPHTSVEIKQQDRAGRAPYNFVPLPREPWREAAPPPDADRYDVDLLTGELDFQLVAKTDFYTRGMWTLAHYQNQTREGETQTKPFMVAGQLRLPGSGLRGMVRSLAEILSFAPLGPLNDTQMFFRTVASVPDPHNKRSFEPQAKAYKDRLLKDMELTVRAGYLYGSRDGWTIQPASFDPSDPDPAARRQWYRYSTQEAWTRRKVQFDPDRGFAKVHSGGSEQGWLVCSGKIPGKQKQWVIRAEDPEASPIPIPSELVLAYQENGISKEILKNRFEYTVHSRGLPCFYVIDRETKKLCAFGHTAYMRMPYRRRPTAALPASQSKTDAQWDLPQALFGRLGTKELEGRRSRVFFEDGFLIEAPPQVTGPTQRVILGQPKPTTYQHYLVQTSEDVAEVVHWDGDLNLLKADTTYLRGHKLYWHRPGAPLPTLSADKSRDNVATEFEPARAGAVFQARIRFENLRPEELGCLLTALALPPGCGHKFGMAKPLGLGSFQVQRIGVRLQSAAARYASLFAAPDQLATGERAVAPQELVAYQDAFAAWVLREEGKKLGHLWAHPRLVELRAMLTLGDAQQLPEWFDRTRYLEFGRPDDYQDGRNYNEYQDVGYPDRPARLEKRRPLPPASQVLKGGPGVPTSRRPRFK